MSNSVTKEYILIEYQTEYFFFFTVVIFLASSPDAILHAQVALIIPILVHTIIYVITYFALWLCINWSINVLNLLSFVNFLRRKYVSGYWEYGKYFY